MSLTLELFSLSHLSLLIFSYGQRPENQWHVCLLACAALLQHTREDMLLFTCEAIHPLRARSPLPGIPIRGEMQLILEAILPAGRQPEIAEP